MSSEEAAVSPAPDSEPKRMGRPRVYREPRRPFTITLPDALIEAIDAEAQSRKEHKTAYIERVLREQPEIAARLAPPEQEECDE